MQEQNQYFLTWVRAKINKDFAFLEHSSTEEIEEAEKELQALTCQERDNDKLKNWIDNNLSDKQTKAMKAAYRKSVSRKQQSFSARTDDAIELDEARSSRLRKLAEYNKVNKRKYINKMIDTEFRKMEEKKHKDREYAESDVYDILRKYHELHTKVFCTFPRTIDRHIEILSWLKTKNSELEQYTPEDFLAVKSGAVKQISALLDSMKEEGFDVVT